MQGNVIITAMVNGTVRTWSIRRSDAIAICNLLAEAGEQTGNSAISNASFIFSTGEHRTSGNDICQLENILPVKRDGSHQD